MGEHRVPELVEGDPLGMAERADGEEKGIPGGAKKVTVRVDRVRAVVEEPPRRPDVRKRVAEPDLGKAPVRRRSEARHKRGKEKRRRLPLRLQSGQESEKLPASSVFLTSAMNWSATAPSISR